MRTLRRPMFRTGGSTGTGITSGLAPRQGYQGTNDASDQRVEKLGDIRNMSIEQLQDLSKSMAYQPRGANVYDFLTQFGLNIASMPPTGNIIQTAATAAKEPYGQFLKGKQDAAKMGYATEADMFKTLIGAQAKIMGSEGGGSTFAAQAIARDVRTLTERIIDNRAEIKTLESQGVQTGKPGSGNVQVDQEKIDELNKQITLDQVELNNLKKRSQYASSMLKSDTFRDGLVNSIMIRLQSQQNPDGTLKYKKGLQDEKLYQDAYQEMLNFLQETETRGGEAVGGRIGYANAGPVMSLPPEPGPAAPPPEETMPEELGGISYEELRASLPKEGSDEIVTLLANSAEALEDFAVIQTEQDIANFNKKYGVNLVLPAEG